MNNILNNIIAKYREKEGNVIFLLQETQDALGYIPEEAVNYLAEKLEIPPSRFYGVATFYSQFYLQPRGRNIITACCGTACHVKGSEKIINGIRMELGLSEGEDTTPDKEFTVEKVNCVGACSIAPVIIVNKKVRGKSSADKMVREIKSLRKTADAKD